MSQIRAVVRAVVFAFVAIGVLGAVLIFRNASKTERAFGTVEEPAKVPLRISSTAMSLITSGPVHYCYSAEGRQVEYAVSGLGAQDRVTALAQQNDRAFVARRGAELAESCGQCPHLYTGTGESIGFRLLDGTYVFYWPDSRRVVLSGWDELRVLPSPP